MAKKSAETFESAMSELEKIVSALENEEPTLDELIEKYNRGVQLSQQCLKDLDKAEAVMDAMIKEDNGGIIELKLEIEGE